MESPQTPVLLLDDTPVLSTVQVARFSGVSYRRIDHYIRVGLLIPSRPSNGSGDPRRFSAFEARVAWLIGRVMDASKSDTAPLVGAVETLRASGRWGGLLIVSPTGAIVVEHAGALLDALAELGPATLVVDLDACPPVDAEP